MRVARLALAAGLALLSSLANGQDRAVVVTSCGTAPHTYTAGSIQPVLVDINGNLCSGSTTGSASLSAVYNVTPPVLVDEAETPLQTDVGGNLKTTLVDENGAAVDWLTPSTVFVPLENTLPTESWGYAAAAGGILNSSTAVTIKAADATDRNCIVTFQISSEALTTATEVAFRDGAGGTVLWRSKIGTAGWIDGREAEFKPPRCGTAATLLEFVGLTPSGAGAIYVNVQGYVTP